MTLACRAPRGTTVLGLRLKPGRRVGISRVGQIAAAIASRIVVFPQPFGPTRRVNSRTRPRASVNSISNGFAPLPS